MTARYFPKDILGSAILREGFSYQRNTATERTPFDSGLARGRLINKNPTSQVPVNYAWDEGRVAIFEAFLQTVAGRGANWFYVELPLEGVTYREVLARVVEYGPRTPMGGGYSRVPVVYEVHDALIAPDGIMDLFDEFGLTGMQDMVEAVGDVSLQPVFDNWIGGAGA